MELEYNITYRQKDKGWQFIVSYKSDGKWKQKSKQGFSTKKEAKPAAEKMVSELKKSQKYNSQIDKTYNSITFKELSDMYIKHIQLYKEYSTIQSYRYAVNKFSNITDLKVVEIKKSHIQEATDCLVRENLLFSTVHGHVSRIKIILQYYKDNFNPNYDIFDKIKIPKDKKDSSKKALTKQQLDELLIKLENNKYYLVVLIAGTCGLRCGEILGLTWTDIDLKDGIIKLVKQWKINKKTRQSDFGTLKGNNSYREVPIPPSTIKILKKYKKINNIVAINNRIAPFSHSAIKLYLNPLLKELYGITLHELRHTYATILISNEIDFKTTAQFLGHDVKQTMETYSHVTDEMVKRATKKISNIF